MSEQEVKAVAAELAVARAGKPSQPGALRKRILYPAESMQKAVRLYRQSGESPSVFALRLGVSPSALTRWVVDAKDGSAFIPVRAADEPSDEPAAAAITTREASAPEPMAATAARCREVAPATPAPPSAATVVVRETVVSIPADVDLGRVREIMMALRGGAAC